MIGRKLFISLIIVSSLLRHSVLGLRWSHGMVVVVVWRMFTPLLVTIGLISATSFPDTFCMVQINKYTEDKKMV